MKKFQDLTRYLQIEIPSLISWVADPWISKQLAWSGVFLIFWSESYNTVRNPTDGITKFWQKCRNFWQFCLKRFRNMVRISQFLIIVRTQEKDLIRLSISDNFQKLIKIRKIYFKILYLCTKVKLMSLIKNSKMHLRKNGQKKSKRKRSYEYFMHTQYFRNVILNFSLPRYYRYLWRYPS